LDGGDPLRSGIAGAGNRHVDDGGDLLHSG
jgi:hypothetical protein